MEILVTNLRIEGIHLLWNKFYSVTILQEKAGRQ